MTIAEIAAAQIIDPFRLGLIVALVFTALRTRAEMGMAIPLALGLVFVAVIIPSTIGTGGADYLPAVLVGIGVNAVQLAAVLAVRAAVLTVRR